MTHGHEILNILKERPYTLGELFEVIEQRFGPEERFFTCHASGLTPEEIIVFFLQHGKIQLSATGCDCSGDHDCSGGNDHCCHHEGGCKSE